MSSARIMLLVSGAIEKLEREFAAWLGVTGAVAAGFGRAAAWLALEAAEVRGGEVLVPDLICAQIPEAVRRAGARPVFYPVRRDLTVDTAGFEAAITRETRAAIVAHYFGRLQPEIAQVAARCRERGVPLIEDCALAWGASLGERRGGTFGDTAIFSFTKNDWCYGGGIVTAQRGDLLEKLLALRGTHLRAAGMLEFRYGLLRRADFTSNRPALARAGEFAGRWLERAMGPRAENFYDAGRFDARLAWFAARRALRILSGLEQDTKHRRTIYHQLTDALQGAEQILLRPQLEAGDAASFLLLRCPPGRAEEWREEGASAGVTLRRCWPAYQELDRAQISSEIRWLAESLLILELHAGLAADELTRIAATFTRVAASGARASEKRGGRR